MLIYTLKVLALYGFIALLILFTILLVAYITK